MPPIRLSDSSSTPSWPPPDRFRSSTVMPSCKEVASLLQGCVEVGPGTVHRAIEQAQRQFFVPPATDHPHKYARTG